MFKDVPDNYDIFEQHEAEQERIQRMRERLAHVYEDAEGKIDDKE